MPRLLAADRALLSVGRAAAAGASVLLAATMISLTIHQRSYLADVGWSATRRTPTEWPSLLALGPTGWLMTAAFAVAAIASALVTYALWAVAGDSAARLRAIGLGLATVGMFGVSFPADPPQTGTASWHAAIHNGLYPLIPLGIIVAATLTAVERKPAHPEAGRARKLSRVLTPIMLVTFALTNLDPIAQLSRYFAFATLLAWVGVAVKDLLREPSANRQDRSAPRAEQR